MALNRSIESHRHFTKIRRDISNVKKANFKALALVVSKKDDTLLSHTENGHTLGGNVFLTDQNSLNYLDAGPQHEHVYKISKLLLLWFMTERFSKFSFIAIYGKWPRP